MSVLVPCFNYAHFLPDCINSVLSQPGIDSEVLIIDDCSTDETSAVGSRLAHIDSRVTFRRHEHNLGLVGTLNDGLAWASGDYTVVLSADDLLTPGSLARATAVMDAHDDIGLVYGRSLYFQSNDALPKTRSVAPRVDRWNGSEWIAQRCKTATNCISSPEVVVRSTVQRQIGGYREEVPHVCDLDMWLRFAAHSNVAYLGRVAQAFYRKHPDSMSRTTFVDPLIDLQQRKAAFDRLFDCYSDRIRDAEQLRTVADRALAREALRAACSAFDRGNTDQAQIDRLEAFAFETFPATARLPERKRLSWRRRIGVRWSQRLRAFDPSRYVNRARSWMWWHRWRTRGV